MKFTISWLKDHLDFDNPLEEILEALVHLGIEVENVKNYQEKYKSFSVAYIKSVQKHPDADKLKVCNVETIDGDLQIVCGAPNAKEGIYVIYAPSGSYIPGLNVRLKDSKIRGVDSFGMMLSEREMCLSDEHDGIIEFTSSKVGIPAAEALGLNDILIEVSITPNRGDLLGIRGIAKDLASFGIGRLKPLSFQKPSFVGESNIDITLDDQVSKRFLATKIIGVKNIESPSWLKNRLRLLGQESYGSLVDISNFICFDLNQPIHCYDLNKLVKAVEDKVNIEVKLSSLETPYTALDEKKYILSDISPVVMINKKIGAIGGIKGGLDSCCDCNTQNILLECAHFDHKIVALAKRELSINTESAYRYEREIDIKSMEEAFYYAVHLINSLCGGENKDFVDVQHTISETKLELSLEDINLLSGVRFSGSEIIETLKKLGFEVFFNNDIFSVIPPSNRNDINDKSVVIAEIIRAYGADNLPRLEIVKNISYNKRAYDGIYARYLLAKKSLAQQGLQEVVSMSFISSKIADLFGLNNQEIHLENPISEDLSVMRKSIVPSLVIVAQNNINRSYDNLNLFEVANIYNDSENQEYVATSLICGNLINKSWLYEPEKYSVWDMKQIAFSIINDLGFNAENMVISQKDLPQYYHPHKSASINMGKTIIGYFGELHPRLLENIGINHNIIVSEVFIERLPESKFKGFVKPNLIMSDFMAITRDFSFIVDKNITAGEIIRLTKSTDKKTIIAVDIFDIYEGENIEQNKKSIAIKVILQAFEKTFVDEEISRISDKIIATLEKHLQAKLRNQ